MNSEQTAVPYCGESGSETLRSVSPSRSTPCCLRAKVSSSCSEGPTGPTRDQSSGMLEDRGTQIDKSVGTCGGWLITCIRIYIHTLNTWRIHSLHITSTKWHEHWSLSLNASNHTFLQHYQIILRNLLWYKCTAVAYTLQLGLHMYVYWPENHK